MQFIMLQRLNGLLKLMSNSFDPMNIRCRVTYQGEFIKNTCDVSLHLDATEAICFKLGIIIMIIIMIMI